MLKLAKNNAPAYDTYSEGDGTDPVLPTPPTLDGSGGTVTTAVVTAYLVATQFRYTGITVAPVSEQAGINWQVSLDNAAWAESVAPADMNALAADVVIPLYLRAVVANDGSVPTGVYVGADINIAATESPA